MENWLDRQLGRNKTNGAVAKLRLLRLQSLENTALRPIRRPIRQKLPE
jgi:hypothetical protein